MLSIIIPVYNAELYLCECIDSILSQDFSDFELLLIDDGSKDNSGDICDRYAEKDSRVSVFHQENQGVCAARNKGLEYAHGEWIAFVDADDLLTHGALRVLHEATVGNDADIILAGAKVTDGIGKNVRPLYSYTPTTSSDVLNMLGHSALWGYLFKTSVIHKHDIKFIPGLAYSEDRVFCLNIALYCNKIRVIADSVYIYRRNETSACASTDGFKKAKHQFHAAAEVQKLALQTANSSTKTFFKKKERQLLELGYMSYAKNFSFRTYAEYESQYLKYFEGRFHLLTKTLKAVAVYYRRRLISFNDNPLTGEMGLKTRVKSLLKMQNLR